MAIQIMNKLAAKIYLIMVVTLVSFGACAQDELNDGPGIISGEKGQFSLTNLFEKKNKIGEKVASSLVSISDAQEFDLFKLWTQSKSANDPTYQEFRLWLEYQEYLHLKKMGK